MPKIESSLYLLEHMDKHDRDRVKSGPEYPLQVIGGWTSFAKQQFERAESLEAENATLRRELAEAKRVVDALETVCFVGQRSIRRDGGYDYEVDVRFLDGRSQFATGSTYGKAVLAALRAAGE